MHDNIQLRCDATGKMHKIKKLTTTGILKWKINLITCPNMLKMNVSIASIDKIPRSDGNLSIIVFVSRCIECEKSFIPIDIHFTALSLIISKFKVFLVVPYLKKHFKKQPSEEGSVKRLGKECLKFYCSRPTWALRHIHNYFVPATIALMEVR